MNVINTLLGSMTQLALLIVKALVEVALAVGYALGRALASVVASWWDKPRKDQWKPRTQRKRRSRRSRY